MKKIEISICDETAAFIQERFKTGAYDSVEKCIEALIDADRYSESEELESLLVEGMDSPSDVLTEDDWASIRKQAMQKSGVATR